MTLSKSPKDIGKSPDTLCMPLSPFTPCTRDILGHRELSTVTEHFGPHLFPIVLAPGRGKVMPELSGPALSDLRLVNPFTGFYAYTSPLCSQPLSSSKVQPGQQLLSSQDHSQCTPLPGEEP